MRPLFRRLSEYNFQYGVATQARRNQEIVHRLLSTFGDDGINEWFAARLERNELRGYLSDLDVANGLTNASDANAVVAIGRATRYALFRASIRSVADHIPPALLARLVESGQTTTDQAISWGLMNTQAGPAFELTVEALRSSGAVILAEQWLDAVDLGARIADADNRVSSIVRFFTDMPEHLRQRMLEVIELEKNEGSRSGALRSLAEITNLDDHTKKEIWRIASEIKQDHIRPEALVVVGARLGRAEQIEAITTYARALSDEIAGRRRDGAIKTDYGARISVDRAAQHLAKYPPDLLLELSSETSDSAVIEALDGAILIQQTKSDPGRLFDQVIDRPFVVPDVVLERICISMGRERRARDALRCLYEMTDERSDHYLAALAHLLAISWLDHEITHFVELFEKLGRNSQQGLQESVIARVVSIPSANESVLRSLASQGKTERKCFELKSMIGRVLSGDEIDELIERITDEPKIAGNLATILTVEQVTRALAAINNSVFLDTERTELLRRLCALGNFDDVLRFLKEDLNSLGIKATTAAISEVWPPDRLSELMATIRPGDTISRVTRLRAWLHSQTPSPQQSLVPAFQQLIAHTTVPERLEQLAKLASFDMSLNDREWLFAEIALAFRSCLDAADSPRAQNAVGWSLDDLALLSADQFPPGSLAKIVSDLVEFNANGDNKIRWLTTIGAGGGSDDDRLAAWCAAYKYCVDAADERGFQSIAKSLRHHDVPLLGRIAESFTDDRHLLLFAVTAGVVADKDTADYLVQRVATHPNAYARLYAYGMILERASAGVQATIANLERSRCVTFESLGALCEWDLVLENAAPGGLDYEGYMHRLDAIEDDESRAYAINRALSSEKLRSWSIQRLTDLAMELEGELRFLVLFSIAPSLPPDKISMIVTTGSWGGVGSSDALIALARSALRQESLPAFADCVASEDRQFRATIIEPLLGKMSVRELDWCLSVERSNQAERFTFSKNHSRYPNFSSTHLTAMARRAAELGAFDLMINFVELKRNSGSSSGADYSLGEILAAVPPDHFNSAISFARDADPSERSEAVAALLNKWPDHTSMPLLDGVVTDFLTSTYVNEIKFSTLLEEPLGRISEQELLALYLKALNHGLGGRREDILDIIGIFARALINRFGPGAAGALEEACTMGCGPHWP